MKFISSIASIAFLAMLHTNQAQADVIVDTGTPTSSTGGVVLGSGEWLAAEFTTTQAWNIGSIQGYISNNNDDNQIGNTFTITVYDDLNNHPDLVDPVEFSQQATFNGNGWNGLSGINNNAGFSLGAGTYWVAFEIGPNNDTFQGTMPVPSANPLATAWYDGISTSGYNTVTGTGYEIGVQIASAVPLPPSLLLFVSGALAIGRFGKRKSI